MSDMQRTELKGRFLLERFKVYFKVSPCVRDGTILHVGIVSVAVQL